LVHAVRLAHIPDVFGAGEALGMAAAGQAAELQSCGLL